MTEGQCVARGCGRPARPNSNRCARHANAYQRYGSDGGPGIRIRQLQAHYEKTAAARLEQLEVGRSASARKSLAWAQQQIAGLRMWAAGYLESNHRWSRQAARFLYRLPLDEPGMQRRLLVRLLATEWAVYGRPPAWKEQHAEAINRGRLFAAGHGYTAPTTKQTLRVIGELLTGDTRLVMWCRKLIEVDEEREGKASAAAKAAMDGLRE